MPSSPSSPGTTLNGVQLKGLVAIEENFLFGSSSSRGGADLGDLEFYAYSDGYQYS
jgi:hypothetical protein